MHFWSRIFNFLQLFFCKVRNCYLNNHITSYTVEPGFYDPSINDYLPPTATFRHGRFVVKMFFEWVTTCQTRPARAALTSLTRNLLVMRYHLNLKLPYSEWVARNKCLFFKVSTPECDRKHEKQTRQNDTHRTVERRNWVDKANEAQEPPWKMRCFGLQNSKPEILEAILRIEATVQAKKLNLTRLRNLNHIL